MDLLMSQKERDRLGVMKALAEGRLSQRQAAERMQLSTRQVRRLQEKYESDGDRALVHKLRGKRSNRQLDDETRQRIKALLKGKYKGFGPTLASEKLVELEGIAVGRETVRKLIRECGGDYAWRRPRAHRKRRARRECFGELLQMDTSEHDWFEGRGPAPVLITLIDDATGRKYQRFFDTDSRDNNMRLIRDCIATQGRPQALYVDKAGHFTHTPGRREVGKTPKPTQIERALAQLDIELILAGSPQAKGRVERSHGTDQDRLIKELRLAGIDDIERANTFLEQVYLPMVNKRFAVAPACDVDAHRDATAYDLDAIFSVQESRQVQNDLTIQVDGRCYQLLPPPEVVGLAKSKVLVEKRLDGTLRVRWHNRYLPLQQLEQRPSRPLQTVETAAPAPRKRPDEKHPWKQAAARAAARKAVRTDDAP